MDDTITITKEQSMLVFKILEPAAVVRPTWVSLFQAMRDKGWI
jgi:hypothetical protein